MYKPYVLLLSLYTLIGSVSFAQPADEKEIAGLVESLRKLMLNPDQTALEELASEDLSYGHSTGLMEDKAAFVDALVKGKTKFTSLTLSNQSIKIVGDLAIVRHRLTGDTFNNNVAGKVDIIILLIWQKQKGQWKLLARQGVKIPPVTN
jgi:hypothetical protein